MHKLGTLLAAAALLAAPAPAAETLRLAENGQARCAICADAAVMAGVGPAPDRLVNPAREEELQRRRLRDSVLDLARCLKAMTGADIAVLTNGPPPEGVLPIRVGAPAAEVFGEAGVTAPFRQGVRVVVDPEKGIGLYGESKLADSYAVYTFLDRLGCRWFFPGDLGEVLPPPGNLAVPVQDVREAPYTIYRGGSGYGFDEAFERRNRLGGMKPPTQHVLEGGYLSKEEKAAHPEWIAEYKDGKPMPNRLKWSSREAAARIGAIICERQAKNPQLFYCLSPDDGARFDESPGDAALDAGDFDPTFQTVSLTDRAVTFYNRIVERVVVEHPDVLFSALAYVQYTRPPVREKPHPNLVIQIAPITYARAHPMSMEGVPDNEGLRRIVEGWGKASRATSYYFYGYFLAEPMCLFPCLRKWANDVPYVYSTGACRYWQPETFGNSEFFALAQWMGIRMAWDPKQDPWALYREANGRLYGPAAGPMWAFWDAADRAWVETPDWSGCGFGHLRRFTPGRLSLLKDLLGKAAETAGTEAERRRVAMTAVSLELTEGFVGLRRDLAEGRWAGLRERGDAWKARCSEAATGAVESRAYSFCWWAKSKTFADQYFDWFYARTHASADRLATHAVLLLDKPLREFRFMPDKDAAGLTNGFASPGYDDSGWKTADVSLDTWSSMGCHNHMGSLWYRARMEVAAPPPGCKVWLWLGATDGSARVFVNGTPVQGGREPRKAGEALALSDDPGGYCDPLVYDISGAVKAGPNTLAILATRTVLNELGTGGLLAPVTVYCEKPAASAAAP